MAQDGASTIADMDLMSGKPACGSGEEVGEYDLGLHVAALCKSILMTSLCSSFFEYPGGNAI